LIAMPFRSDSLGPNIRRLHGLSRDAIESPPVGTVSGAAQDAKESAVAWSAKVERDAGGTPWLQDVERLTNWNDRFRGGTQMGFEFGAPPPPEPMPSGGSKEEG
jgi:hypothetical protein